MTRSSTHAQSQGYKKLGFSHKDGSIVYREWAPAAQAACLIGE